MAVAYDNRTGKKLMNASEIISLSTRKTMELIKKIKS
jgi:hypothetical protein